MKKVIWQNYDLNLDDWKGFFEEVCPDADDDEKWDRVLEMNWEYLDDERANLNIPVENGIIAVANLGFWNRRADGWKEIGGNVNNCLQFFDGCDYAEFAVEDGDLKTKQTHHDGTHFVTFRKWKPGLDCYEKDVLKDAIYEGRAAKELVEKYTDSLAPEVCGVYGWEE